MKRLFASAAAIAFAAGLVSAPAVVHADSKNWSAEKQEQVERNRFSNAGVGNGGENYDTGAKPNRDGEDGRGDDDPGNSGANNKAGKNDKD